MNLIYKDFCPICDAYIAKEDIHRTKYNADVYECSKATTHYKYIKSLDVDEPYESITLNIYQFHIEYYKFDEPNFKTTISLIEPNNIWWYDEYPELNYKELLSFDSIFQINFKNLEKTKKRIEDLLIWL